MKAPGAAGLVAGVHRQLLSDRQICDSTSDIFVAAGLDAVVERVSVAADFLAASLSVDRAGGAVFAGSVGAALAEGGGGSLGGPSARGVSDVAMGATASLERGQRLASTITNASRRPMPTTTHIVLR